LVLVDYFLSMLSLLVSVIKLSSVEVLEALDYLSR
jgi:hypothetical protein